MNKTGILKILLFNDSRKVGLGVWIYFTTMPLFAFSLIYNAIHPPLVGSIAVGMTFDQYVILLSLVTILVGGGTLADKWMKTKEGKNVNVPA